MIAHLRDIGWSLLVTYWDGGSLDARKLDALPDKVDGILIDGEASLPRSCGAWRPGCRSSRSGEPRTGADMTA